MQEPVVVTEVVVCTGLCEWVCDFAGCYCTVCGWDDVPSGGMM
jgi:hypothetical protein